MNSEITSLAASLNEEMQSLKESLNNEVKQKIKTLTDNMNTLQLNFNNQIHNAQMESFKNITEIDGRLNDQNRKINYLWAESLAKDCPWIKSEYMLNDTNYLSQIGNLLDDLAANQIDMETFKKSTYNITAEKISIKLEPIDSDYKKVKILNILQNIELNIRSLISNYISKC